MPSGRRAWTLGGATLVALLVLGGCGGSDATGPGSNNVVLRITDTPFADARSVLVTFDEVQIHRSGAGWETVPFADGGAARTCDLKKLEGAQDVLGVGTLPEGHYTQIRLVVTEASIHFDNATPGDAACAPSVAAPAGDRAELQIPSGEVKLNRQFDVGASGATTILLDFDGNQSIRETGNRRYRMTPVIAVASVS